MGEAKRKGTREQRIASSKERQRIADEWASQAKALQLQEAREWWESLTPAQQNAERRKRRKARAAANTLFSIAGSLEPGFLDLLMED